MTTDRAAAQRRANRIRAFRAELDALVAAGAVELTDEQREAIRRHHDGALRDLAAATDVDLSEAASRLSRGMQLASWLAAAALTAAVYSLVSRVWGRLDVPMQATLLCVFPLAALVGVELSARRDRTLSVAALFAVVAYGTFWLAVAVLGDMFNIPLTPIAIWAGVLFGLALALPYGFRLILAAAVTALTVALPGTLVQAAGIPWIVVLDHPEMPLAGAVVATLTALPLSRVSPSLGETARLTAVAIALLALLALSTEASLSLMPWPERLVEGLYQAVALVAGVAVLAAAIRSGDGWLANLAAGFLTLFLIGRFYDWFFDVLPRYAFFLGLAALAFAWVLGLRRLRARMKGA